MNIASLIVRTLPEHLATLESALRALDWVDVHIVDPSGKIIVTIEGADTGEEIAKQRCLGAMDHVLAADMVYTYGENEWSLARDEAGNAELIAQSVNDENAEGVRYGGHVGTHMSNL